MFRLVKRSEISRKKSIVIRLLAILLAFTAAGILLLTLDLNPLEVYASMIKGAFGSAYRVREVVIKTVPLVITSLGIAIAFKMLFWNIGADGQILMGAFAASYVALNYGDLPRFLLLLLMFVAGALGGGLWALIPGFFRAQWRTNETIITLMMNYVALKWITYLQYGPWKDPQAMGFPKIPNFTANAVLPKLFGVHVGWLIMLLLIVIIHVFLNHTKKGYEIAVLGESENTALYAGMNVKNTIVSAIFLSGALCGIAGMIEASAVSNTLSVEVSGGVGYTAIITTWLGALKPLVILLVSLLFAALLQGGSFIQTAHGIPESTALLLQGMILFFVLGSEFFIRYRVILRKE